MNKIMNKIIWYLKQLLPLTYRTTYSCDHVRRFVVWRMWFGRCFDIDDYAIG